MIEFSPELQVGPNVRLRFYTSSDAATLAAVIDENRAHLRPWFPWVDGSRTVQDAAAFIERATKQAADGVGAHYMIEHDGQMAGTVGFHDVDEGNQKAMLGYWLIPSYCGRGLMTASVRRLLDHAFDDLRLNRIGLAAGVENLKSRAVAERVGMVAEGIHRQVERLNGRFLDHIIYSRLRSEHNPHDLAIMTGPTA